MISGATVVGRQIAIRTETDSVRDDPEHGRERWIVNSAMRPAISKTQHARNAAAKSSEQRFAWPIEQVANSCKPQGSTTQRRGIGDAVHPVAVWRRFLAPIRDSFLVFAPWASPSPTQGACDPHGTSEQHNTHIIEFRQVLYPWHPWYGLRVGVHATLVRRGVAVAHCSSEGVYPPRHLELPLWMLDSAACSRVRAAKSGNVNVESLRELRRLLHSVLCTSGELAKSAEHRYLLSAGGADVHAAWSPEHCSTVVVCVPPVESREESIVACSLDRCSAEDCAVAGTTAPASQRLIARRRPSRGGGR